MFSKKVTCSIIVLNELDNLSVDTKSDKWLKVSQLASLCNVASHEITPILQQMCHHNLIDHHGDCVRLVCNPAQVTLYELIASFHGGMPIGEESEHDYHQLDYYADPKYPRIVLLEGEVLDFAKRYLGKITIASLGNRKQKYD